MAQYSGLGIDLPFAASGDMNDYQYHFVRCASTRNKIEVAVGACNPVAIGVLQNDPNTNDSAQVRVAGITKVKCDAGAAIVYGNLLTSASNGRAMITAGSHMLGIALEDDTTGCAYITMLLRPMNTIIVSTY